MPTVGVAQPHSLRLPSDAGVPRSGEYLGGSPCRGAIGATEWPTSPPSLACTSRCRSIREAWAFCRATTSRAPRTKAFRSLVSACTTTRDTSGNVWIRTVGSTKTISTSIAETFRFNRPPGRDGRPVVVSIDTRTGRVSARVWKLSVGRTQLYLLDSDVPGNDPEDRELTARLYGGDTRTRIRQELMLGVGGVRALVALGITPGVVHLNEGHRAFAVLELMRQNMETQGTDVRRSDATSRPTHRVYHAHASACRARSLLGRHDRGAFGAAPGRNAHEPRHTDGTGARRPIQPSRVLLHDRVGAKALAAHNAVSSLHGEVSRSMWAWPWPSRGQDEVPIGHITNGVHVLSWLAPQMQQLFERRSEPTGPSD